MTEGNVWKTNSWETKTPGFYEKMISKKASAIMTATEAMAKRLRMEGVMGEIIRVPSCVDLNFLGLQRKKEWLPEGGCVLQKMNVS